MTSKLILFFYTLSCLLYSTTGIDCYQCNSTDHINPFQCTEFLGNVDLQPQPCTSVFEARYCIKHTGRFEVDCFSCYQCSTVESLECSDTSIHDGLLAPGSCDHVEDAEYCIKTTGFYGGGLGTKRFCSHLDLGNYCNYIKQPGDELEYRSCVYTCSTYGCNESTVFAPLSPVFLLCTLTTLLIISLF